MKTIFITTFVVLSIILKRSEFLSLIDLNATPKKIENIII